MLSEYPKFVYFQTDPTIAPEKVEDPVEEEALEKKGYGKYPYSPVPIDRTPVPDLVTKTGDNAPRHTEWPKFVYHKIGQNIPPEIVHNAAELAALGNLWSVHPWSQAGSDAARVDMAKEAEAKANPPAPVKVEAPAPPAPVVQPAVVQPKVDAQAEAKAPIAPPISPKGK